MASPRMLAQRAEQANLVPRPFRLNRAAQPRTMAPGEYAGLLRQSARQANARDRQQHAATVAASDTARGFERTIPTSGLGRRRAKALRNKAAIEQPREWVAWVAEDRAFTIQRGRQYEGATIEPTGTPFDTLRQP